MEFQKISYSCVFWKTISKAGYFGFQRIDLEHYERVTQEAGGNQEILSTGGNFEDIGRDQDSRRGREDFRNAGNLRGPLRIRKAR